MWVGYHYEQLRSIPWETLWDCRHISTKNICLSISFHSLQVKNCLWCIHSPEHAAWTSHHHLRLPEASEFVEAERNGKLLVYKGAVYK